MAQLVLGAVGAFAGSFVGAPGLGFAIGSAIGGALFAPTQKQQGPRLSDLKVSGTEAGQPIPYFEGKFRTAGQIAWASDRREIATTTEQGKGGGGVESTTYTYEVDLLYLLSDHEAATFARVWNNGKLVFNNLPSASVGTAVASETTELWRRITFYSGASTQLPEPTYEAAVGLGNAPAYRGRATIFIEGLQLGGSGQIPNLSFEVFRDITSADVNTVFASLQRPNPVAYYTDAVYKDSAWFLSNTTSGSTTFTVQKSKKFGPFAFKRTVVINGRYSNFDPVWVQTNGAPQFVYCSFSGPNPTDPFYIEAVNPETGIFTTVVTYVWGTASNICRPRLRCVAYDSIQKVYVIAPIGDAFVDGNAPYIFTGGLGYTRCASITGLAALAAHMGYIYALANNGGFWRVQRYNYAGVYVDEVVDTLGVFGGSGLATYSGWIRVDPDGQCWVFNNYTGRLFKVTTGFQEVSTASNTITYNSDTLNGVFYCTDKYAAFGFDYAAGPNTISYNFRRFKTPTAVQPTLQAVVQRLCARAGLDSSQYDVSALATITRPVRSMAISQVTPIRQVLETLASSFFFGCSLSDKLFLRPRGGSSVATLAYDDLGAGEGQAEAEPFELKTGSELELPAQIALTYANVDGDYNVATEYSDRLLVGQTSTSAIQVPLGFTPSEAKGIADTLVADAAGSLITSTISVLSDYTRLEPTDVISVLDQDGSSYRMRVRRKTEAGPVIKLDLVTDDASVLTSAGITSNAYTSSTAVVSSADTILRLLDIPILRDADDPLGLYVAFAGETSPWPGAALFKSPDDSTYERRQTATDAAGMGATTTALTTWAGGFVFDETSTVTVVMDSGTLSSYTRDQILSGLAPAYLIGSEIVYARSAELIAADTYRLTGFLRGVRGTEWAMAGHAAFENVTVLSAAGLRREDMDTGEIGALRYFKAPTLGRALSTAEAQSITLAAVGKKPFAPVNLRAQYGSVEPYFTSVGLLLHFNGANGQTTTVDSSQTPKTMTMSGSALSTTLPKFGAASLSLTGGVQVVSTPTSADFQMGSGDFTIECWVKISSFSGDQTVLIHQSSGAVTDIGFIIAVSGGAINFQMGSGGSIYAPISTGGIVGQWQHVAAVRFGNTLTIYVDGVAGGTTATVTGLSMNAASGGSLRIGNRLDGLYQFIGSVDEVRITKGVARYTANFTPPDAPFPDASSSTGTPISWDRRSRFAKNFTNGYVPLGEEIEAYEVDIWSSNTYSTLKRTITSNTPSVNYSAAQQIADFGSLQTALYVDVYQISAAVGRGYRLRGAV